MYTCRFPSGLQTFKFEFRHCNLVQPSSKLAAEALLSETGNKPICIKYFVIVCFLSTHLFIYVYKRADKNFEIQTNVVLGKNKRTNISKKKATCSFQKSSFKKRISKLFKKTKKCSSKGEKRTDKHYNQQHRV